MVGERGGAGQVTVVILPKCGWLPVRFQGFSEDIPILFRKKRGKRMGQHTDGGKDEGMA